MLVPHISGPMDPSQPQTENYPLFNPCVLMSSLIVEPSALHCSGFSEHFPVITHRQCFVFLLGGVCVNGFFFFVPLSSVSFSVLIQTVWLFKHIKQDV